MAVEIKEVGVESLPRYAEIPISFKVESILQVETISIGFGFGIKFRARLGAVCGGVKFYPTNQTNLQF
jgi:hypothetical protein